VASKIFPRNLTARADYEVRGNPASTRPEDGVDNCFPGLEFDQRNLDKQFLPGLTVEFHRDEGAQVVAVDAEHGLPETDQPLFVWAVAGRVDVDQPPIFDCAGRSGPRVWRRVHDLLPGRIAVVVGPGPARGLTDQGIATVQRIWADGQSVVQRDDDGGLTIAVLVAERARYLTPDGVIDPDTYAPGELTRTLCAPWQYDFRDCGCFYWAASKPDIVTSSDGRHDNLNFIRRDRTSVPPPPDLPHDENRARRATEFDHADLIHGWNDLPVVVNDRESGPVVALPPFDVDEMTREQVITELTYLATVEHALCVEYLFAHLSLDAPERLPDGPRDDEVARIHAAAAEVFAIAVDEMRHLRWANEALNLLGAPPSLGRADRIGRSLDRPFALEPLTPQQLAWFIDVERPSQVVGTGVDGMYVRLHSTITRRPDLFPESERLVHLLKLIIDEGDDHFHRFTAVQSHLAGLDPARYLRRLADEPDDDDGRRLLDLADQNYAALLGALHLTFGFGDTAGGRLMEQSRRAMRNLHETNQLLAIRGVRPRFALPAAVTEAATLVADLAGSVRAALGGFRAMQDATERAVALRQAADNQALVTQMLRLTDAGARR
jgi:hypothetical protein